MKKGYCFYLEDELVDKIKRVAKKENRSESFIVQRILEEELKEKEDG